MRISWDRLKSKLLMRWENNGSVWVLGGKEHLSHWEKQLLAHLEHSFTITMEKRQSAQLLLNKKLLVKMLIITNLQAKLFSKDIQTTIQHPNLNNHTQQAEYQGFNQQKRWRLHLTLKSQRQLNHPHHIKWFRKVQLMKESRLLNSRELQHHSKATMNNK